MTATGASAAGDGFEQGWHVPGAGGGGGVAAAATYLYFPRCAEGQKGGGRSMYTLYMHYLWERLPGALKSMGENGWN